jgi:antitoxin (DNA-binding transcriptional repressor) of toxin-antitoxin stability system
MEVFSLAEWEDRFDELIKRVEEGEHIGIVREDGKAAVFLPADDPLVNLYTNHNEAS